MKTFFILFLLSFSAVAADEEETEALRALRLACEKHKISLGCFNYANLLIRHNKIEVSEAYFEKGCSLGHAPSCQREKWDLPERTQIANELIPVPRDYSKAAEGTTEIAQESSSSEPDVSASVTETETETETIPDLESAPDQMTEIKPTDYSEQSATSSEPILPQVAPTQAAESESVSSPSQPAVANIIPEPGTEPTPEPVAEYTPDESIEEVTEAEPNPEPTPELVSEPSTSPEPIPMPETSEPMIGSSPASVPEESPAELSPTPESQEMNSGEGENTGE